MRLDGATNANLRIFYLKHLQTFVITSVLDTFSSWVQGVLHVLVRGD